ncbi:MAG: hypothetical protein ACK4SY_10270 [Pyrobaculum sp.]
MAIAILIGLAVAYVVAMLWGLRQGTPIDLAFASTVAILTLPLVRVRMWLVAIPAFFAAVAVFTVFGAHAYYVYNKVDIDYSDGVILSLIAAAVALVKKM